MNAARTTHTTHRHGPATAKTGFPASGDARSVAVVKVVTLHDAFAAVRAGAIPTGTTGPYGPAA
ncbi:hypothetical protein ACFV2S_25970 [Streptomyces sp. NPDC059695]|uniref:hypothetical protein n=1 Tax=Streptomyces sp. NPDC059695 TaxID=3346910 RepID=UPI00368239A7